MKTHSEIAHQYGALPVKILLMMTSGEMGQYLVCGNTMFVSTCPVDFVL